MMPLISLPLPRDRMTSIRRRLLSRENRLGTLMKTSRICVLVALVLVCSMAVFADSIKDPKIIIHGVQGGGGIFAMCPPQGCTTVGLTFTFTSPAKGEGTLFFTDASGKNWTSLELIERGVPGSDIACDQSLFLSCT